jgi:nicotinamide-nucleotide amidase
MLAEKVAPFLELQNPTVAPYANHGEVKLRIAARAESEAIALQLIEPVEQQLRQIGGSDYYGADEDSLATVVGAQLQAAQETLSTAESCTGGGLGQMLTSVPGSSNYFWGGVIAYDNQVKKALLDVDPDTLDQYGAVSHEVAKQMAVGVRSRLGTTWGLSITGIAGPGGGTPAKPVGLVYIGLAGPDQVLESYEYHFGSLRSRAWIQNISACTALDQLRRKLLARQVSENLHF